MNSISPVNYSNKIINNKNLPQINRYNMRQASLLSVKKQNNVTFGGFKDKAYNAVRWLAEKQNLNAQVCNATIVLGLATTLRPAAILAMPGAKKEDKQYSAAKSITTGIVGLLTAIAIYRPLEHSLSKLSGKLEYIAKLNGKPLEEMDVATKKLVKKFPYKHDSKEFEILSYILNKGSFFIVGPIQAFAMINTIPKVVRKVFPKSTDKKEASPRNNIAFRDYLSNYSASIKGGAKCI